jgi:hypothetical protein
LQDKKVERNLFINRLGREEVKEFGQLAGVLCVFVNTELEILTKRLVELGEVVLVLRNLTEKSQAFLDDVLAYNFEDLILLECLARDVEKEILRVDDTLDEVQIFQNKVLAVVYDENAADIKLDVVAFLLCLEEIERCTIQHIRKCEHPRKKSYRLGTKRMALNSS